MLLLAPTNVYGAVICEPDAWYRERQKVPIPEHVFVDHAF